MAHFSRRTVSTFLPAAVLSGPRLAYGSPASAGHDLYADVVRYAAYGPKRTGSTADHAISDWLAEEATRVGAEVHIQRIPLRRFEVEAARLAIGSDQLDCFPLWFPKSSSGRLRLPLAALDTAPGGSLAYKSLSDGLAGLREIPAAVRLAAERQCAGLVLVTKTPSGMAFAHGLGAQTPMPTLLVGGKHQERLGRVLESREPVEFELSGQTVDGEARNVIASFGNLEQPIIGVSTPTSAWLTAGGERGSGVALWLALLRRAAATRRGPYLFSAVSGHELDALGGRHFAASDLAPLPSQVRSWCHLGASIATRSIAPANAAEDDAQERFSPETRIVCSSERLERDVGRFMGNVPYRVLSSRDAPVRGELKLYLDKGYETFGFEGAGPLFHTSIDDHKATSPMLLGRVYEGLAELMGHFEERNQ
jgi:hypothetical protein